MFCSICGNQLIENAKFCDGCGTKTQNIICDTCNTPIIKNARFCDNCGAKSQILSIEKNRTSFLINWMERVKLLSRIPHEKRMFVLVLGFVAIFIVGWLIIGIFSNPIKGRWTLDVVLNGSSSGVVHEIEFFSNGTGIMQGRGFAWRTERNRLIITEPGGGGRADVYRFSVSRSRLTFIYDERTNHHAIYRRTSRSEQRTQSPPTPPPPPTPRPTATPTPAPTPAPAGSF
ncbi:MAG: zinc ribbon domain-containing protein [Defluviitaleaceae bacterium]|nr:zinc ribbon domain-containing protein [Defluviitaleaceae bacterium]